jgi:hypothetical protein
MIDDAYLQVTESLEAMLQHIQSDTEILTLWTDQLCINQDDLAEKKAQVPLMKKIYQEAIRTIVWLGPAAIDSNSVIDFLADVGKEAYEFGLTQISLADLKNWSNESEKGERQREIKQSLDLLLQNKGPNFPVEAFGRLITRGWFSRVWVVQEVSLAKEVVFVCGEKKISYDHFRAAKFFYTLYAWSVISKRQHFDTIRGDTWETVTALNSINTSLLTSMLSARRKYQTQTGTMGELSISC